MKINSKFFKIITMVLVLLVFSMPVFADAPPTLPDDPEAVPIDGGISLLVAAGVGYAAKKKMEKANKVDK